MSMVTYLGWLQVRGGRLLCRFETCTSDARASAESATSKGTLDRVNRGAGLRAARRYYHVARAGFFQRRDFALSDDGRWARVNVTSCQRGLWTFDAGGAGGLLLCDCADHRVVTGANLTASGYSDRVFLFRRYGARGDSDQPIERIPESGGSFVWGDPVRVGLGCLAGGRTGVDRVHISGAESARVTALHDRREPGATRGN